MSIKELPLRPNRLARQEQQTTVNVQEKANLIWAIADKLVGVYKPHEYGNVILPMCVVKRFEDTLAPTKQKVLDMNKQLDADGITVKQGFLEKAAGQKFYNLSPFTFETLLSDPENIRENFESYLNHFSENVIDVIHRMKFQQEIETMAEKGDAGSGESNIRGYLLENDWLEAIVQLPNDLFYNTGIATYIWVITRNKSAERQGKVQLIDASQCYEKRRKPLGNKRVEITETARQLIMQAYHDFKDGVYLPSDLHVRTDLQSGRTEYEHLQCDEMRVESKVRVNDYFKYSKIFIKSPEKDTEIIPWLTDRDEYLQKNVAPYSPGFVVDEKKTRIGYEIPFTREFYKYTPLKPSADIFEELKVLEQQEAEIMNKLLH